MAVAEDVLALDVPVDDALHDSDKGGVGGGVQQGVLALDVLAEDAACGEKGCSLRGGEARMMEKARIPSLKTDSDFRSGGLGRKDSGPAAVNRRVDKGLKRHTNRPES